MSSIKDIARISGTSLATVSRVLNDSGYVGKATRERVELAVTELGYEPNAGARQMRSGKTRLIGILLPTLDVSFFGILAHTLEQCLFDHGYHGLICSTSENEKHEARYISTLLAQNVDGIIAASAFTETRHFARVVQEDIPIIAIDRSLGDMTEHSIAVDHREGGRMMAQHLVDLGHRRIAVVGAPGHSSPIGLRVAGVCDVLEKLDLEPAAIKLTETHSFSACYALAHEVLSQENPPTAIIGTTDIAAIGSIHAGHDLGFHLPGNLSVIGFDDLPESAYVLPRLTNVAQPVRELGKAAVEQLLHLIEPDKFPEPPGRDLGLELKVRESTAAPDRSF